MIELPKLEDLLETAKLDSRIGRFSFKKIEERILNIKEDYELYAKILKMEKEGLKPTKMSKILSLPLPTIKSWLYGDRIPCSIASIVRGYNKRNGREFITPKGEDPRFSYVLGYYLGNVCRSGEIKSRIYYNGEHREISDRIVENFNKVLGTDYFKRKGNNLELRSVNLFSSLYQLFSNYTRMPWEHVNTNSEKLEFLRGYFDAKLNSRRFIDNNRIYIRIDTVSTPKIIEQLVVLLSDIGTLPFYDSKNHYILFADPYDANKLLDNKIIVGETDKLKKKVSGASDSKYVLEAYRTFLELKQKGASFKEISKKITSVPKGILDGWQYYGSVPLIAKRNEKIHELRKIYEYRNAVTYLFREVGLRCKPKDLDIVAKGYGSVENLSREIAVLECECVLKENYLEALKSRMPNRLYGGGLIMF